MASPEYARVLAHLDALYSSEAPPAASNVDAAVAEMRRVSELYPNVDGEDPKLDPNTKVTQVDAAGVPGEWVCATGADADRRLLFIHGGAWVAGTAFVYRNVTEALSRYAGASVLAIDYRLAPEHPYPAGLEDCIDAYVWLLANGLARSGPAQVAFIAGDSAGGNLALASLLHIKALGMRMPDAAATIGAATDLTGSGDSMTTRAHLDPMISREKVDFIAPIYVQKGTPLTDPGVSPLYGELSGLPPLLMHVGEREVLFDDSARFVNRARATGVDATLRIWLEMIHVFEGFCHILPEGQQSLEGIGEFFRAHV